MKSKIFILLFLFTSSIVCAQTFRVVNMIPNALSNETGQDSEPHLSINPNDPLQIIGSAFTRNPTGTTTSAPVYISQDGGNTWVLNNIVPSSNGMTGDITVGLSRNNILYSGILYGGLDLQMRILRSGTYLAPGLMGNLLTRNDIDQPYVVTHTPLGGARVNLDHVYVGNNDFNPASGQSASIEQSLDAQTAPAPANLTTIRLEQRATGGQDGPPIRTAPHANGTVYAAFDRFEAFTSTGWNQWLISQFDVIVARDDNWGLGASPYQDLTDPSDGLAGRIVVNDIQVPFNPGTAMGQARIGDRLSIAVDPRDSETVYLAYTDRPAGVTGNTITIHVCRSTDSGNNWSGDLLTVNGAIIPDLAVNIQGDIGFLYQQLTGAAPNQQWVTHYRQSTNGGTTWTDQILSQTRASAPIATFTPYLGDYAGLTAVGKDFYGVFSANNTPDNANFPNGVTYQRNANFTTNNLRNLANTANVNVSIDPFFFEVEKIPDNQDFYVRDWTNNPTTFDIGLEPSTQPVFYTTSDVWNRRSDAAGGFNANDQPQSRNPQISALGNNFAFTRVHRKGTGTAETVTLHFLKSELGTGSNYVNANTTADPTLSFAVGEPVKTMTSGYEWTLTDASSTHTCLAVETNTTNDPVVSPTLLGRAPGWPNTDLSVLYDNNKGQRNMGVYSIGSAPGGFITYYAILHNAATYVRDFILHYELTDPFVRYFKRPKFEFPGVEHGIELGNDRIIISKMKPGENRWIGITVPASVSLGDNMAAINFTEVVDNIAVNGFTIAVISGPDKEAIFDNYRLHAEVFFRMGHLFELNDAFEESEKTIEELVKSSAGPDKYLAYIKDHKELIQKLTEVVLDKNGGNDPFGVKPALTELLNSLSSGDPLKLMMAHAGYNHKIDAFLTYFDKQKGDVADILQNIYWQLELYRSVELLKNVDGSKDLVKQSEKFYQAFNTNKAHYKDYSELINNLMEVYNKTSEVVEPFRIDLTKELRALNNSLNNPQYLQKLHYDLLLKLNSLRKVAREP